MPPTVRIATDATARPVVLVASPTPTLVVARRRLGGALVWYVVMLSVLTALGSIVGEGPLRRPQMPELAWRDWGGPGGLASVAVRAFPIGFVLALGRRRRGWLAAGAAAWRVAAAGAAIAAVGELAHWMWRMPVRPPVIAAGAAAALIGELCYERTFARRRGDHAFASGLDRVLPLELPLTGAVVLLVPTLWLASQHVDRVALIALPGCFGASLLASARLSRGPAAGGAWTHAAVAAAWLGAAVLPAWLLAPRTAAAVVALAAALAAAHALLPPPDATDRRFEGPALRRALPLLAAFVATAAAWPLTGELRGALAPLATWGWGSGGVRGAIEHGTAFAVLGYVAAELRGRREESPALVWRGIVPWVTAAAAAVELVRAYHPAHVAGGARAAAAVLAARLGATIYARHRDHVRAWLAAGGRVRGGTGRIGLRDPAGARAAGGRRRR